MPKPIEVRDQQDYVYAQIERFRVSSQELDYIAIWHDDNLITISIEDAPTFMRALLRAMNS